MLLGAPSLTLCSDRLFEKVHRYSIVWKKVAGALWRRQFERFQMPAASFDLKFSEQKSLEVDNHSTTKSDMTVDEADYHLSSNARPKNLVSIQYANDSSGRKTYPVRHRHLIYQKVAANDETKQVLLLTLAHV